MNLPEDKHWSYGVDSGLTERVGQTLFYLTSPIQTEKTANRMVENLGELHDIGTSRVPSPPAPGRVSRRRA